MARAPNVCLRLANRPENVLVVRQALTGLAECMALGAIETNDVNTAVSEACNNVVMHAYGEGEGPMEVDAYVLSDGLEVLVRDRGRGLDLDAEDPHALMEGRAGIGVPVMEALAREAELRPRDGGGTDVRMEFATPEAVHLDRLEVEEDSPDGAGGPGPAAAAFEERPGAGEDGASAVSLRLAPAAVARAVLPRVLSTLAARAHFSTDRISDIQLIADVLAANAGNSVDGAHLCIDVALAPRSLALRLGPLHSGRGESLMAAAADGLAPVVERLTDGTRVSPGERGETLELQLVDRR